MPPRRRWASARRQPRQPPAGFSWPSLVLAIGLLLVLGLVNLPLSDGAPSLSAGAAPCAGADCLVGSQPGGCQPADCQGGPARPSTRLASRSGNPPLLTARSAALIEGECGLPLYELNDHQPLPPASITKIVTALVAVDQFGLDDVVEVQVDGPALSLETDSTIMGLTPGMKLPVRDLLYGLLLPSGNDAALALAEQLPGGVPAFLQLMNAKADSLGLKDSRFANPHGLDSFGHYASAYDMAQFGHELMKRPELAEIVKTRVYQPAWEGPQVWNGNGLLDYYPSTVGIKIGYTNLAGQTIVAAAEKNGRMLILSVMGSSTLYQDAEALLDWAFTNTADRCA